jgi:hypothetical protein
MSHLHNALRVTAFSLHREKQYKQCLYGDNRGMVERQFEKPKITHILQRH